MLGLWSLITKQPVQFGNYTSCNNHFRHPKASHTKALDKIIFILSYYFYFLLINSLFGYQFLKKSMIKKVFKFCNS